MVLVRPCKRWNKFPKCSWTRGLTLPCKGGSAPGLPAECAGTGSGVGLGSARCDSSVITELFWGRGIGASVSPWGWLEPGWHGSRSLWMLSGPVTTKKMMINNNLLNENYSSGCSGLAMRCEGDFSGLDGCWREWGFDLPVLQSIPLGRPSSCICPGSKATGRSGTGMQPLRRKQIFLCFLTIVHFPAYFML